MSNALILTTFDVQGRLVANGVSRGLAAAGFAPVRLEALEAGSGWSGAVTAAITSADLIVVDVSEHNPNVFYELGYAHGLRKPTILLTAIDSAKRFPSDLEGFLFLVYDPRNLESLAEQVRRAALAHTPGRIKTNG